MNLKDASLFREQGYIDGAWMDADDGGKIEVDNPADNSVVGTIPKMARSRPAAPLRPPMQPIPNGGRSRARNAPGSCAIGSTWSCKIRKILPS